MGEMLGPDFPKNKGASQRGYKSEPRLGPPTYAELGIEQKRSLWPVFKFLNPFCAKNWLNFGVAPHRTIGTTFDRT
jgi:hypothetical protein